MKIYLPNDLLFRRNLPKVLFFTLILLLISAAASAQRIASVDISPTPQTECIPSSGTFNVVYSVTPVRGQNGTVNATYTVTGLPPGVTANSLPGFTSNGGSAFPSTTLNLTVASTAMPGNYSISVTLSSGSEQETGIAELLLREAPLITCPSDYFLNADPGECSAIVNFAATTTGTPAPTITYSHAPGSAFPVGTTTVTASVTSSCGTDVCSFDVIISDDENPVVTCPADINQTADAGACGAIVNFAATATDNCGVASITYSHSSGSFFAVGTTTVTATATDIHSNVSSCSFDVIISDDENPVVTCPADINLTADAGSCGALVTFAATATDNCGITSITYSHASGSFFAVGTSTVTATATDVNGNISSCSFDVIISDDENPVVTCPADINQTADAGSCGAIVNFAATATDNCGIASITYSQNSGSFFAVGTTTVTATATDIHGNVSSCSFDVIISDDENPVVTCPADINQTADAGACGAIVNFAATATDNCGITSITYSHASGSFFAVGTTTVTATATDVHGNISTCSFDVIISDDENPVVTCPADINQTADAGACGAIVNFAATATDNCGIASITYSHASGSFFAVGTTTVTATATDINGNVSSCSFDVIISDDENPVVTCPADINLTADAGSCGALVTFTATATDNCGVASITYSHASGSFFAVGTTTVTATATDIHGNISGCSFDVIISDDENPVVTCPANINQTADAGACGAIVNFAATATDNCGVASITYTHASGSFFAVGTTTVTATATDIHGNVSTCSFDVIISDDENPVVTCPANINQTADAGACGALVTFAATATDNCAVASITYSHASGSFFAVGTTTVTATATDVHGNVSTCSFDVVITDDENPVVTCHADINQTADAGACGAIVNFAATATDNCGVASIRYSQDHGTFFPVGTTTVTATATDIHGNVSTCSFDVTISDDEIPVVTCPANINQTADAGACGAIVNFAATATDNCGVASITYSHSSGSLFPVETTTVTATATDIHGNVSSCSFDVIITDDENPVVTCPADINQTADAGSCGAIVTFAATATDNCGIASITYSHASGSLFSVGTTTVTATATEIHGNVSSCSFDVIITDDENPVVTCPADINQTADAGACGAIVTFAATATDNCAVASITYSHASGSFFAVGTTTVTATATDVHGNVSTCSFDVIISDDENPLVTCPADINQTADAGACGAIVNFAATATDNCGIASITYSHASGSLFSVGTTTVTATATDIHGNVSSCSFDVIITDDENPVVTCPADINQTADAGSCGAIVTFAATATDNCGVASIAYSQNSGTFFSVGTTTVTATATDIHGNVSSCSFDVIITDDENPVINCPANLEFCFGEEVNLNSPIATDNCGIISINSITPISYVVGTNEVVWIATDVNGNTSSCTQIVTINPLPVPVATAIDPIVCEGATTDVIVTASGASSPYTGTGTFNLAAGEHTFIVTDANGCVDSTSIIIAENILNLLVTNNILYNGEMVSCNGASDASVELFHFSIYNPGGASAGPFEYSMNNGTFQSSNIFSGLSAGNYTFEVKDLSTGCIKSVLFEITQPVQLTATTTLINNVLCQGGNTGSAIANPSGGTGAYTYNWLTPIPKQTQTNSDLAAGTWTVVVTDANGCTANATVTITEPAASLTVDLGPDKPVLYGAFGYTGCTNITPVVSDGTAPYSYEWTSVEDPAINGSSANPLNICQTTEGDFSYTVIVTDANGCTASATVTYTWVNIDCSKNQNGTKVYMCNITPAGCNTICVSVNAVPALLNNGNYIGSCQPDCSVPPARLNETAPAVSSAQLDVYPNPGKGYVHIKYTSEFANAEMITITDLQGRVVQSLNISGAYEYHGTVDLSNFENGIYFVNVLEVDGVIKSTRLVKAE